MRTVQVSIGLSDMQSQGTLLKCIIVRRLNQIILYLESYLKTNKRTSRDNCRQSRQLTETDLNQHACIVKYFSQNI